MLPDDCDAAYRTPLVAPLPSDTESAPNPD